MENEQKDTPQEETQEELEQVVQIDRVLNLAFNIDRADQMIDGANKLANFVDILEQKIGLLGLNLNVSINPFEDKEKKNNTIGYKTEAFGEKVEVENEFDCEDDDEDYPDDEDKLRIK